MKPFIVTIPHSGEQIPTEATWLQGLGEPLVMCDIDRFVDRLYVPTLEELKIPAVVAEWHRYVVDLNRVPEDIDQDSVVGSVSPSGTHPNGYHWVFTTRGTRLMPKPISRELHGEWTQKIYEPFHQAVRGLYADFFSRGFEKVYHLDAHSMPSMGTQAHRDPGERRAEIVVSDFDGVSCEPRFKDLVMESYRSAGFQVGYNWPYKGGRLTQVYGQPAKGQHALQVELNRGLYMDEETKQILPQSDEVRRKISMALHRILQEL